MAYEFIVFCRPGETMGLTDYLSRSPKDSVKGEEDDGMLTIVLVTMLARAKILKHRMKLLRPEKIESNQRRLRAFESRPSRFDVGRQS